MTVDQDNIEAVGLSKFIAIDKINSKLIMSPFCQDN